ncbi:TIGR01212 family radical SAM protein [Butyrivibrio fibrisolvens]|uniref:TIGR01212 family radical SAM protein n=1 Tax=Butyrivibrio fibrisolvens TaxID=831 RepID=UPI00041DB085|nr:TIGR01212 family radical SAM protein [Butyrivibrio fibrisolvens]
MNINTLSDYLKRTYGCKVYKLSLQSGCTCPNRDGTVGNGGCTFCSEGGSGDFAAFFLTKDENGNSISIEENVDRQIESAKEKVAAKLKGKGHKYIAYFQSFTNTYGNLKVLEKIYRQALSHPEIVALSIGTRPDCLPDEIISILESLRNEYGKDIWIELGLQTINEDTARHFRRGYELPVFEDAYRRLKEKGFTVIVHVILGLPGESEEDMLATVGYLAELSPRLDGIKLQLLHVLKGTDLAKEFEETGFHVFTLEEYCDLVVKCLKLLPKDIVVHRITGDGPKRLLIAPLWSANKKLVLNTLNKAIKDA